TTVDGHRVHYWDIGQGSPLLLIHGLGISALTWHRVLRGLAQGHRVVALDLVGHGLSGMPRRDFDIWAGAEFVAHFAEQVQAQSAVWVGSSMGGLLSIAAALRYPTIASGLVLVDSAGLGREIALWLRGMTIPGLGEWFDKPKPDRIKGMLRSLLYDPSFATDEWVEAIVAQRATHTGPNAMLRFLRTGVNIFGQKRSIQLQGRLDEIRPPILVLWGRHDPLLPVKHAEGVGRRNTTLRVHIFDHCGHWPQIEQADAFTRLVSEFAERVALSASATAPNA
ncbi:MAG: alpha/beta fold hydrolase, partial [Chloroflexi bacterium]|nr:alpha/beta fold hydrolase [Chloroflexota bacterium]